MGTLDKRLQKIEGMFGGKEATIEPLKPLSAEELEALHRTILTLNEFFEARSDIFSPSYHWDVRPDDGPMMATRNAYASISAALLKVTYQVLPASPHVLEEMAKDSRLQSFVRLLEHLHGCSEVKEQEDGLQDRD
jgi:hypothetical protein